MATTITVVCPNCNNRMRASAEYIGRKGRCPSCKSLVEIRSAADDQSMVTMHPVTDRQEAKALLNPTEVPSWQGGLVGLAATAILYLLVFWPLSYLTWEPLKNVGLLFVARGWIPYVIVLVTCWGLALLVLKAIAVKRQQGYAELELELIPLEIGLQITPDNVDQFLDHLGSTPIAQRLSILGRRIQAALEHFKSRKSVPEVQEYLAKHAEIDASSVDAGYTLLRAFIWAVPILGFIGTVIGISAAVGELRTALDAGQDIREGLEGITQGLSTAFDTTLIALIMAILLLFPTESLRKSEYQMLDRIEFFANEQLLRRMTDVGEGPDLERMPDVVKDALGAAFQEHQRWLVEWQAQVAELGRIVGGEFEQVVMRVEDRMSNTETKRLDRLSDVSRMLSEVFERLAGATASWQQAEEQFLSRTQQVVEAVQKMETTFHDDATRLRGDGSSARNRSDDADG